ncbi:MAG TPA: DUF5676 family membrane protein [Vicinamibacterales bacterium]|nr:DUF5676 family membrane protein [Vicinamibacterales bacterium]
MRIDARSFGLTAGAVAGVMFVLCSIAVALSPEATADTFGGLTHLALGGLARTPTWAGFVTGLVVWSVGTAAVFGTAAALYNRLVRRSELGIEAETPTMVHH